MFKLKPCLRAMALSLSLCVAGSAAASPVPDYPFVHVVGSAYVAAPPDIAALDFEMVAVDADPAAARTVLETRIAEIRALMQTLDMDADDAVVREVRQNVVKGEQASGGAQYELRCDVKIKVRNVSNWAALAGGLFGKPNLDGFASSFDLSTMEQTNDQLVTGAIQDARRRAEVIAAASGRRLGAVTAVTPEAIKNLSTAMGLQRDEFRMERRAGGAAKPGTTREQLLMIPALQLNQPVDVIFRLENLGAARPRASRKP